MRSFLKSQPAVVAIPARNEAERLPACLDALTAQTDLDGRPLMAGAFGVLVFANGCRDASAAVARRCAARSRFPIRVVEERLPRALRHAGGARGRAMDLGCDWLGEFADDGVILTTDADSRVAPDWIAANLARFASGADAVLGRIALDEEGRRLPPALHARGKLESVYEDLLTEIAARVDPQDENPWPHHATVSGASLALTRRAYLAVGGLPRVPLGEDKALVAELRRRDFALCFAPEVQVVTSGRTQGRAAGGVADTLKWRSLDPAAPCDEALETCLVAFRRARWRGRLRRAADKRAPSFGLTWERIERESPRLLRRRLRPSDLPGQIALATRLLRRLQALTAAREDGAARERRPLNAQDFDAVAD